MEKDRMNDELKVKYHEAMRKYYDHDESRMARNNSDRRTRLSESMGYYAGKIVSGYIIGYIIGTVLGCWFVYAYIVKPIVIPVLLAFYEGFTGHPLNW